MKTATEVIATLIAVLVPGLVIGQEQSNQPVKPVHISGRVEDQTTAPFVKMTVVLKVRGLQDTTARTETDQNGLFAFDVPANTYDLHFQSPGFAPVVKTIRAVGGAIDVGAVRLQVAPTDYPTVVAAEGEQQGQGQEPKPTPKLWAAISVPQPIYAEGYETEHLQICFGVYNDGASAVGPNVESSHLYINGVEPQDWPFVIGNGIRNDLFRSLPPGEILQ